MKFNSVYPSHTFYFAIVLLMMLSAFVVVDNSNSYRKVKNESFAMGERLSFKVHVGPINAGYSVMSVSDTIYEINGRNCFKIDVEGSTTRFFDMFIKVRDVWGTYLDIEAILPHRFYRNIAENKYRKYEIVDFDHQNQQAVVTLLDKNTKQPKAVKPFNISAQSQDLVSGYYFLRTMDYSQFVVGDTISIPAFFDDESYNFTLIYIGQEVLKTKLGKINALVLSPLMPENSLFDGENAIQVWLSDDQNKIPLKVKAKMFVGAVEIDITEAMNIKSPINYLN